MIESLNAWMGKVLGIPFLGSRHGADVDALVIFVHWLMLFLFVGWLAYFAYALVRFSAKRNPKADSVGVRNHVSTYLEIAVAVIEGVLLIGLAVPMWAKQVDAYPPDQDATVIRVVAEQFTWNARYPGEDGVFGKQDMLLASRENTLGYIPGDENGKDDATPPMKDMRVPLQTVDRDGDGEPDKHDDGTLVRKPVVIHLTSKDVIHSFKVNTLRVCQDCIPGMSIPIHFEPTVANKYLITCAQLCGSGHSKMNGWLTVMENTPDEPGGEGAFDKWLKEHVPQANAPTGFE
ncbi:MAG: cytochrome c oxidase subunit II [Limisphaerales bacterium]